MLADILHKVAGFEQSQYPYTPRPSSNDKCVRALTYHALDIPKKPFPGRTIMVFEDGHIHEALTGDWINKTAYRLHSDQMEVECYSINGRVQKGHIDGVITDLLAVDRLFEHKAISHFSFQRIWGGEMPLGYIGQCCCYIRGLQKIVPEIDQALLLIKNKNTAQYLEILIHYDADKDLCRLESMIRSTGETEDLNIEYPNIIQNIINKFEEVEKHRQAGTLPDRPYTFNESSHYPCSYCQWGEECWRTYVNEVDALEKNAALDEELETLAGYYLEHNLHIDEMTKEKEELRRQVIQALKDRGVSGGRAGNYSIILSMTSRTSIDKAKIPPAVLTQAQTTSTSERLSIRKLNK